MNIYLIRIFQETETNAFVFYLKVKSVRCILNHNRGLQLGLVNGCRRIGKKWQPDKLQTAKVYLNESNNTLVAFIPKISLLTFSRFRFPTSGFLLPVSYFWFSFSGLLLPILNQCFIFLVPGCAHPQLSLAKYTKKPQLQLVVSFPVAICLRRTVGQPKLHLYWELMTSITIPRCSSTSTVCCP